MPWFVLRDLTRPNNKYPAYKKLSDLGFEVFTPMHWVVDSKPGGKNHRRECPVVHDLLFVNSERSELDPVIDTIETLQYRYLRGAPYRTPMEVPTSDMDRFMAAIRSTTTPQYFTPDELQPSMIGREVRIVGGPLDGFDGRLLSIRGLRKRKLLISLPSIITAAVEVNPDFIQFI